MQTAISTVVEGTYEKFDVDKGVVSVITTGSLLTYYTYTIYTSIISTFLYTYDLTTAIVRTYLNPFKTEEVLTILTFKLDPPMTGTSGLSTILVTTIISTEGEGGGGGGGRPGGGPGPLPTSLGWPGGATTRLDVPTVFYIILEG